jgi:hypothetical protein
LASWIWIQIVNPDPAKSKRFHCSCDDSLFTEDKFFSF